MAHQTGGRARSLKRANFLRRAAVATLPLLLVACTTSGSKPHSQATGLATSASQSRVDFAVGGTRRRAVDRGTWDRVHRRLIRADRLPGRVRERGIGLRIQRSCRLSPCGADAGSALPGASGWSVVPGDTGSEVDTAEFGGIALGTGPVRPIIASGPASDAQRGIAHLSTPPACPRGSLSRHCGSAIPSIRVRSSSAPPASTGPA